MSLNKNLVPHILCAVSSAPDRQQSVAQICRFVENRLREEGKEVNDVKNEIDKAIQIAYDFGLVSTSNNTVRLKYNPNSKSSFAFQSSDVQRESQSSVHSESCNEAVDEDEEEEEDDGDEGTQNGSTTTEINKLKSSKSSGKKICGCSVCAPVQSKIRSKRKSRGRSSARRSRSSRRRRRYY